MKMNRISRLLSSYQSQLQLQWNTTLHGSERVWFAIYDPTNERRLRYRLKEFELATFEAGRKWGHVDVSSYFEVWLSGVEYLESYFKEPDSLEMLFADFETFVQERLARECEMADESTVFAISGIGMLFGIARVSNVVNRLANSVRGRLLVFFPGSYKDHTYRLLNIEGRYDYRAVAIMS